MVSEIGIGDIVKFKGDGGEIGRVCKENEISATVHFKLSGCLRVGKSDLELTSGKVPQCKGTCP